MKYLLTIWIGLSLFFSNSYAIASSEYKQGTIPEILIGKWWGPCRKMRTTSAQIRFDIRDGVVIVVTEEYKGTECNIKIGSRKAWWSVYVPNPNLNTKYGRAVIVDQTLENVEISGELIDISDNENSGYTIYQSIFVDKGKFKLGKFTSGQYIGLPENRPTTPSDTEVFYKE